MVSVENLSLFALIYLPEGTPSTLDGWESFIIRLDWYTYVDSTTIGFLVENLSLFALIYLDHRLHRRWAGWESFIIRLDILTSGHVSSILELRIFHYSPWYTYICSAVIHEKVENLSLFALIYLSLSCTVTFIMLRIFHYSPWYTYDLIAIRYRHVENLSLFALIYLGEGACWTATSWESFIIRLDILKVSRLVPRILLRIFHYSPWYTYYPSPWVRESVENLSLFALIYLHCRREN